MPPLESTRRRRLPSAVELTRLKENGRRLSGELEEVLGIGVLFVDAREHRDVRRPILQLVHGPSRGVGIVVFITVLERTRDKDRISPTTISGEKQRVYLQSPWNMTGRSQRTCLRCLSSGADLKFAERR